MKIILFALTAIVFTLSACAPVANVPPTDIQTATPQVSKPIPTPASTDSNLVRGNVFVDSTDLLILESYPLQFTLALKGSLPTPCNQLRVDVNPPDSENKIIVEVYSVIPADAICAQVMEPFEENIPLGSFPAGHYTLWVNGELVTEFDA